MAQEHKVERRPELCPSIKPPEKKPCNSKPCDPEDQRPPIASSNSTYIQHDPKKNKVWGTLPLSHEQINSILLLSLGNSKNRRCCDRFLWDPSQNQVSRQKVIFERINLIALRIRTKKLFLDSIEPKSNGAEIGNLYVNRRKLKSRKKELYEF